jgi:hypothetical protein
MEHVLPTDRTALRGILQGVFASFLVSTVLVMYNASQHTEIESRLTTDSAALEEVLMFSLWSLPGPQVALDAFESRRTASMGRFRTYRSM